MHAADEGLRWHSLFVHMPHFADMHKDEQMKAATAVLVSIQAQLTGPRQSEERGTMFSAVMLVFKFFHRTMSNCWARFLGMQPNS